MDSAVSRILVVPSNVTPLLLATFYLLMSGGSWYDGRGVIVTVEVKFVERVAEHGQREM